MTKMKTNSLFALLLALLSPYMVINAQSNKTFDCDMFSFEYPPTFKPYPISNAPHMLLKLESHDYILSASYRDAGIHGNKSIWDYDFSNLYKAQKSDVVSITKETLELKSGTQRCVKIMTNVHNRQNGTVIDIKMLSYHIIHNGCLLTFAFASNGKYNKESITTYPEKILRGLKLKYKEAKVVNHEQQLLESIKKMNSQFPMQVDDCTTYLQIVLSGKTIMLKTLIEDECDDLIDFDEFKRKVCENYSVALEKPFVEYLDENGYSLLYMIFNSNDRLKKKIQITGKDILKYY